jgi:hypothetical protein
LIAPLATGGRLDIGKEGKAVGIEQIQLEQVTLLLDISIGLTVYSRRLLFIFIPLVIAGYRKIIENA